MSNGSATTHRNRKRAIKADKKVKTIAGRLARELERNLPLESAHRERLPGNPQQYEHLTNNPQPAQGSTQFTPQQQPHLLQETEPIHRTEQHLESSIGDSTGSLFDMPILSNGDAPEEEKFRRRMQQQ